MWIFPLFRWEWRKLDFLLSLTQLFLGIIFSLRDDRSRCALIDFLLNLRPRLQSISFQLNQHLLFHQMAVLIRHLIVLLLEYNMIIPQFFEIEVEFLLLLLDPLMMHLIKILLLEQFLISSSRFLRHNDGLIEFLLQPSNLVLQSFILLVFLRYLLHSLNDCSLLDELIPLLLEVIKSIGHFVLDEEIPQEEVDSFSIRVDLRDALHFCMVIKVQN